MFAVDHYFIQAVAMWIDHISTTTCTVVKVVEFEKAKPPVEFDLHVFMSSCRCKVLSLSFSLPLNDECRSLDCRFEIGNDFSTRAERDGPTET